MNYVEKLRQIIGHEPVILVGAVTIVVDENGLILLQQRKIPFGKWGLPGGLMELEESTEETAVREIYEESGLIIKDLKLLDVVSGKNCYIKVDNGDEFFSVTVAYYTYNFSGKLNVDKDESLDFRFFKIGEIPENIVGSHKKIICKYIDTVMNK